MLKTWLMPPPRELSRLTRSTSAFGSRWIATVSTFGAADRAGPDAVVPSDPPAGAVAVGAAPGAHAPRTISSSPRAALVFRQKEWGFGMQRPPSGMHGCADRVSFVGRQVRPVGSRRRSKQK